MSKKKFVPQSVQPSTSSFQGYIIIMLLFVIAVLLYRSVFIHEDGGQLVGPTDEVVIQFPTPQLTPYDNSLLPAAIPTVTSLPFRDVTFESCSNVGCSTGSQPPRELTAFPEGIPPPPTIPLSK